MADIAIVYDENLEYLKMGRHFHNSYEIIIVLDGSAQFVINSKNYDIRSGSIVFISHLESHEMKVTDYPYRRYYILVNPRILQTVINDGRLTSILTNRPEGFNHVLSMCSEEMGPIEAVLEEMKKETQIAEDFHNIALPALLQLFFIKLYRIRKESFPLNSLNGPSSTVLDVQKYIDEHCLEQISLKNISDRFFLNMYYLSHLFKKVLGFSLKDYIILQRISRAKDLLVKSDINITGVCTSSGFGNINHFIRIFKKYEGITPNQYRKNYRSSAKTFE